MKKHAPRKIKHILYTTFFSVSIPTLLLLLVLTGYTIHRQVDADRTDIQRQITQICNNMEDVLNRSEAQLTNLTALGTSFQIFHYSDTELEKHQYAYDIMQILHPLLTQDPCLGGFFLYSAQTEYYYPAYQMNYPYSDQKLLKEFLTQPVHPVTERNRWIPFQLSDRIVLLRMVGYDDTICAVMVDPTLDSSASDAINPDQNTFIFYASKEGKPYTSELLSENIQIPSADKYFQKLQYQGKTYQLIRTSSADYDLQICHLMPYQGILSHLNMFQKILLITIILLILSMSLIGFYLYKKLIYPIRTLMDTMYKVGEGDLSLRANENYSVEELQSLSLTFNEMLHNIHRLKLESYEKKLDLQQARLQYLQLQIRPHFYLNCLKGLFSMAEKRQYHEIQESVLALSEYFRYIFRNNKEFVSLSEEVHSVSSYLKLQQMYFSCYPKLTMEISAETTDIPIPPLSILTFVENSIKHCSDLTQINIHIKALLVTIEEQQYLNITISDNCGGFSNEALETLNHLDEHDFRYKDYHVGIYNIFYRMKLTYNNQSTLAFYNIEDQGCAELFIPVQKGGY